METSTLNGANGTLAQGIVPLSMKEIEMVAGAKASSPPPKSIWERILNWIGGEGPAPTSPQAIPQPDASLLQACLAAGGTFTYEYSSGGGAAVLAIVRADGEGTTIRITCTPP